MTVLRREGELPSTPMVALDIVPYVGWSEAEENRRMKQARVAAYRQAEDERQSQGTKKRQRDLRLRRVDHEKRVGVRGSAARAGMMLPTAERELHDEVIVEDRIILDEKSGGMVRARGPRVVTQTPLDRYRHRGNINERQFKAGEKLRSDWYVSGLEPHTVANLMGSGGGGECSYGMAKSEGQAIAREEWRQAIKATGIRLSPILIAVCCEDRTAPDWLLSTGHREPRGTDDAGKPETDDKISKRVQHEAMVTLRIALDVLANHYGY